MARARSAGKAARLPAGGTPGRSIVWLQGLLCGAVVTLATPSALLALVLLAPAGVAWRTDHQPGKPVGRAVLACALAGAVYPLARLWRGGHGMELAVAMLGDAWTWLPAWGAAGGGWLLAELAPAGVRLTLELAASARAARLRAQRTRLEREWGLGQDDPDEAG